MGEEMNRLGGINRTFRLIIGVINERSLSAGGDHGVNLKSSVLIFSREKMEEGKVAFQRYESKMIIRGEFKPHRRELKRIPKEKRARTNLIRFKFYPSF